MTLYVELWCNLARISQKLYDSFDLGDDSGLIVTEIECSILPDTVPEDDIWSNEMNTIRLGDAVAENIQVGKH